MFSQNMRNILSKSTVKNPIVPLKALSMLQIRTNRSSFTAAAAASSTSTSSNECYPENLLSTILSGYLPAYWEQTPAAEASIACLEEWLPDAQIAFDHFAFRTFGVESLGIASLTQWFIDLGYQEGGTLEFEKKKLRARWLKPPQDELPRIFISELKVELMPPKIQEIIHKYTQPHSKLLGKYGPLTGYFGTVPWEVPSMEDYKIVAEASEYAAWVLVNGYNLNHTTVAVHRLSGLKNGISAVNEKLKEQGLILNEEGGEIKISPDGLLLQSSTVADEVEFTFSGGEAIKVPGPYIEFAERLVLPEFSHLPAEEIKEHHRRVGFEAANADKIFESTTATARRLANEK